MVPLEPVAANTPLRALRALAPGSEPFGVWVAGRRRRLVHRHRRLELDGDLYRLARRYPRVAVAGPAGLRLVTAAEIRAARTLRVVLAAPATELTLPLGDASPEELLAGLRRLGRRIVGSAIRYPAYPAPPG